jgi:hypothetical protein
MSTCDNCGLELADPLAPKPTAVSYDTPSFTTVGYTTVEEKPDGFSPASLPATSSPDTFDQEDYWKHSTVMAYIALISVVVITTLLLYSVDVQKIEKISEFITWFYMGMTTIVGGYMGLKTWATKAK